MISVYLSVTGNEIQNPAHEIQKFMNLTCCTVKRERLCESAIQPFLDRGVRSPWICNPEFTAWMALLDYLTHGATIEILVFTSRTSSQDYQKKLTIFHYSHVILIWKQSNIQNEVLKH